MRQPRPSGSGRVSSKRSDRNVPHAAAERGCGIGGSAGAGGGGGGGGGGGVPQAGSPAASAAMRRRGRNATSLHPRQPLRVRLVVAPHHVEVALLHAPSQGADRAVAERPVVDLADGGDLGGGPGEEGLVGEVE